MQSPGSLPTGEGGLCQTFQVQSGSRGCGEPCKVPALFLRNLQIVNVATEMQVEPSLLGSCREPCKHTPFPQSLATPKFTLNTTPLSLQGHESGYCVTSLVPYPQRLTQAVNLPKGLRATSLEPCFPSIYSHILSSPGSSINKCCWLSPFFQLLTHHAR